MDKRRKTGGRKAGTPNKWTAEREQEIAESGETPLEFSLRVMRDEKQPLELRLQASKAAFPFCHRRLPARTELELINANKEERETLDMSVYSEGELLQLRALLEKGERKALNCSDSKVGGE